MPEPIPYRCLVGLDYEADGRHVRHEPGDIADDIPAKSAVWLLAQGLIEPAADPQGDTRRGER